ncbi:MAG: tRNA pseudouridine(55) synthase TruB [Gammaproteobacteria bacterium]
MAKRKAYGNKINGILLLDKPQGITSNAALQTVKRLFMARKAGHTGSLDPLATGMLPICFGEATKMSAFLLEADKRYLVQIKLGEKTSTADAEGEIIERKAVLEVNESRVRQVMDSFRGQIEQIPPMYSAIKQNGQPLYKLARQGISVGRAPRKVVIHELTLTGIQEDILELEVHCSKGTYIRTLAEDLGDQLGCGAHVVKLRRLAVAKFDAESMVSLDDIKNLAERGKNDLYQRLLPTESALSQWPEVNLSTDVAYFLKKGQAVLVPQAPKQGFVRLYSGESGFLGVGQILDDGRVAPRRLVNI